MTEKAIQSKILKFLKSEFPDAVIIKLSTESTFAGIPDIMMLNDSICYFFEVKRPKQNPTKLQSHIIERINAAGGIARVVRSIKDLKEVI